MNKSHNSLASIAQNYVTWGDVTLGRFFPYALFGILAFSLTSASPLPSFLKLYLMLGEITLGLLVIYLTLPKLLKLNKNKPKLRN